MSAIFVGTCFVAKYPEGGGNFSVPLQYMLGLRRLGKRAIWLEVMESTGFPDQDARKARLFRERLKSFGMENDYCLFVFPKGSTTMEWEAARCFGIGRRKFRDLLAGPNVLLDLSYSVKPPLVEAFEHRKLCSLDPTEVCFWMNRMEMGQSTHHEFWTIGLNAAGPGSRVPQTQVQWKTYFPLVDTTLLKQLLRPPKPRFTTIGQWYWDGMVEFEGEWRDFSKQAAWEKFMNLPSMVPEAELELAMNLKPGDPERDRIIAHGWRYVQPHSISQTAARYYRYIAGSMAEFSGVKLESFTRSGWLSDRSAAFLACGRPVITESTGAEAYLPAESGMFFVDDAEQAAEAVRLVMSDWDRLSGIARDTAEEFFDAERGIRKILG